MTADSAEDRGRLTQECSTFTRYLVGRHADTYVVQKYLDMQPAVLRGAPPVLAIDEALVRFASKGPWRARVADAYARVFRPTGLLRRKLVLAFAILESSAAFHQQFTTGHRGSVWTAWFTIVRAMVGYGAAVSVGVLLFAPRQLWSSVSGESSE